MSAFEAGKYPVPGAELARFTALGRETGTLTIVGRTRAAARLGLSSTDQQTFDLVSQAGTPLTAGRIAELTGLSTGAITGVVDRLERAGFVRRVRDERDRRKVFVEVVPTGEEPAEPIFEALEGVLSRFSPSERAVVERFQNTMLAELRAEVLGDSAHVS
jgi:DNA-binding MarR family transcriptional regulator